MIDPLQQDYDMEVWAGKSPEKDKKSKSATYNNGYIRKISPQEAEEIMGSGGNFGPRCSKLQDDLERAWKDFEIEEKNCKKLVMQEEDMRKTEIQLITWEKEQEDGSISERGRQALAAMSPEEADTLVNNVREKRLKSQKLKDEFLKRIEGIRKEIQTIKRKRGTNVVWKDEATGQMVMKWGSGSKEASERQSLKRDKYKVAQDYVTMLCTAEEMIKISWEKSFQLVKEYQESFEMGSIDFELMAKVIYRLEKDRALMSREQFTIACWESLSQELQREYILAKGVIDTDSDSRYEFGLPVDKDRRMKVLEKDKKLPSQVKRKEEVKKMEEVKRYNNLVRGSRGRTSFRGRGSGRGYNTTYRGGFRFGAPRGYNSNSGYNSTYNNRGGRGFRGGYRGNTRPNYTPRPQQRREFGGRYQQPQGYGNFQSNLAQSHNVQPRGGTRGRARGFRGR